ncbi:hypothetical protein GCM10009692_27250 [Leucobacter aridicollis]
MGITCGEILNFSRNMPPDLGFMVSTRFKLFNLKVQLECYLIPGRVENFASTERAGLPALAWTAAPGVHRPFSGVSARMRLPGDAVGGREGLPSGTPAVRGSGRRRRPRARAGNTAPPSHEGAATTQTSGAGSNMEPAPLVSAETLSAA